MHSLQSLWRVYRSSITFLAHVLVMVCLLVLGVNAALSLAYKCWDRYFKTLNPVTQKYHQAIQKAYAGQDPQMTEALLKETWSRPFVYQPFTEFKERPFSGAYVHVSSEGYRQNESGLPWPPARDRFNVFVFGGSTTFGYGVTDNQTVPAHLERLLRERSPRGLAVYNFGVGYYYSSQERVLFEKLLVQGAVPDLAIFIDGFNEFNQAQDEPEMTPDLRVFVDGPVRRSFAALIFREWKTTSLSRFLGTFRHACIGWWSRGRRSSSGPGAMPKAKLLEILTRYERNQKMIEAIARANHVNVLFVWQPIPYYQYDIRKHLFAGPNLNSDAGNGYAEAERLWRSRSGRDDFLWCADLQDSLEGILYIDNVHYSSRMSEELARRIERFLETKHWAPAIPIGR